MTHAPSPTAYLHVYLKSPLFYAADRNSVHNPEIFAPAIDEAQRRRMSGFLMDFVHQRGDASLRVTDEDGVALELVAQSRQLSISGIDKGGKRLTRVFDHGTYAFMFTIAGVQLSGIGPDSDPADEIPGDFFAKLAV